MTRTTAAVLALGAALTLAGCSGSGSTPKSAGGSTSAPSSPTASAPAGSATPSTTPSTTPSAPAATASTSPSVAATGTAASTAPATSIPATVISPGSTPTGTAGGTSTRCKNGQLTVSLGPPDRGAGQIYSQIVFRNSGTTSCTLAGHPGVSYVAGDDGHQVGASATRTGSTTTTVTLMPGDVASALLHETNYANFDQAACKPVAVRGLRVYPPGSTAAVFLARVSTQCSATALPDPALSIAVVKAGAGT